MKIVVLDGYTLNPGDLTWDGLEKLGDVEIYDRTPFDLILERIKDAEIVLTNKTPLTRETIEKSEKLKYIGVLATGYNVVDTIAAKEKNIPVTNIPTYGTASVAQHAIALLLELCNRVGEHSLSVKKGDWSNNKDFCYWLDPLKELGEKTIGIVGFGRIGQKTAQIAQALGMKVLANANHKKPELENENCKFVDLDYLFKESDVISLHCPLTPSTEGLINKETISHMKDGVFIVNTSRGPLIVEKDLKDALNSGKVGGAAIDVASTEPIKNDNPLMGAKNIIITPHIAWAPIEARSRLMNIAVENVSKFIEANPINVVNN